MTHTVYSLYMLRCVDGSLYTGIAVDVQRRLREHAGGTRGAKYLRGRAPFRIVFQEAVGDRAIATKLEQRVKRLPKPSKEDLAAGRTTLRALGVATADQASGGSGG